VSVKDTVAQRLAPEVIESSADDLDGVCSKIAAGAFKDRESWIEQLRTAAKVFSSS
jgi:hypothetical protein